MDNLDQQVVLLQEIRDNQVKQTEAVTRAMKQIEETQTAYLDSQKKYDHNQDDFRKNQEAYRKNLPLQIIMAVSFGVIAVCMLVNLVLRLMGK